MSAAMTPPPSVAGMPIDVLSGIVTAIQGDPPSFSDGIRQRVEQSQQGTHVQMMGGWTENDA